MPISGRRICHCAVNAGFALSLACATAAFATPVGEEISYPDLLTRLGITVPDGSSVVVGQVESIENGTPGRYSPPPTHAEFTGVDILAQSGPATASSHAREVALRFYGSASSIAPGVPTAYIYEVNGYVQNNSLRITTGLPPLPTIGGLKVMNHSWAGDAPALNNEILRRMDWVVDRDDVVMCIGVPNAGMTDLALAANGYNGITVGLANGTHISSDSPSGVDVPGRMKPDVVVPGSLTSFVTPIVSSAAALLIDGVRNDPANPALVNGERSEVIKAVILAGADRNAAWTNNPPTSGPMRGSTMRPLDAVFGAGVVNVDIAHQILFAGEQNGTMGFPFDPNISSVGWDFVGLGNGQTALYRFNLPVTAERASVAVTWHRHIAESTIAPITANIDVALVRLPPEGGVQLLVGDAGVGIFGAGNVESASDVDNVEMLVINDLAPGDYIVQLKMISGDTTGGPWDVAMAWNVELADTPPNLCPTDCAPDNGDGTYGNGDVNIDDIVAVINSFGDTGGPCDNAPDNGDGTFGNGEVNIDDLVAALNSFGACPSP
jgi:hypothetical protein